MAERDTDTVQLTDLEVIQQFSLAVRGATATRREVIEALEADLAYLTSTRKAAAPKPVAAPEPVDVTPAAAVQAPAKVAAKVTAKVTAKVPLKAPAKKAPAKKAPPAKATRAPRR